ncbi:DUF1989 domain-containing protein [Nocardioides ultimimeridianus]
MSRVHELPGGACFTLPLAAGEALSMTSLSPVTNVTMQLFAADRLDRLNVPDTMKAQMSACVTAPMVLMSDRGCALASVVGSTTPWHDCLGGMSHDVHVDAFGTTSYGVERNEWRRSARAGLVLELAKYGLGEADLHAPVNWFSSVAIEPGAGLGALRPAGADQRVRLRADLDVLVVLSTAIHPLATSPATGGVRLEVTTYDGDDPCAPWREESARALGMSAWARTGVPA